MLIAINLPDTTGTQLITRIYETIPKIRKIIVANYSTFENAIASMNQGADGYIIKPLDTKKLVCTVEEQLEKQEHHSKQNGKGETYSSLARIRTILNWDAAAL